MFDDVWSPNIYRLDRPLVIFVAQLQDMFVTCLISVPSPKILQKTYATYFVFLQCFVDLWFLNRGQFLLTALNHQVRLPVCLFYEHLCQDCLAIFLVYYKIRYLSNFSTFSKNRRRNIQLYGSRFVFLPCFVFYPRWIPLRFHLKVVRTQECLFVFFKLLQIETHLIKEGPWSTRTNRTTGFIGETLSHRVRVKVK